MIVGLKVGAVGLAEGFIDGNSVGFKEGRLLGNLVGFTEGVFDGVLLGFTVGVVGSLEMVGSETMGLRVVFKVGLIDGL